MIRSAIGAVELLIIGQHPEYQDALSSDTDLVDGVNPRLHIALHKVVATRLWNNHPRSTWREAKKLLAEGVAPHDALHALATDVADEVHAALSIDLGLIGAMGASVPPHVGRLSRHGRPARSLGRPDLSG